MDCATSSALHVICCNRQPSTTLGRSGSEVMLEALPAAGAAQQDAGEHGQDAPPDGGQAPPGGGPRRGTGGGRGWGGAAGSGGVATLFPPEPQVLQEGEGEPAQERVVVQAAPGAALEVVEPQLLLELLVRLLAHPARLDQRRQLLQGRVRREVREVVLALARGPALADQPDLLAGQVPAIPELLALGRAHP